MTMFNYITLDGHKYRCVYKQWAPATDKPMTVRYAWDGTIDVTYGPAMFKSWRGVIIADASPATGFGSDANMRTTIGKLASVQFIDHYQITYTVHVQPIGEERSYSAKWDIAGNSVLFPVQLYAEA